MYYLVLFFVLVLLAFLDISVENKRIKELLLVLAYLLLLFTSGFRYETGVDWRAYAGMVDETMPMDMINTPAGYDSVFAGIDVGFKLLISCVKYFGGGLQTVFFIISFISISFLSASLKRYLRYPVMGLLLYYGMIYFYLDMSGMRQATSLSIFLYSLKYIQYKKPIKHYFLLLIAFTFHWSTLFLFPIYWLNKLKINKVVVGTVLCFSIALYLINVKWITSLIPSLFTLLQDTNFAGKIVEYSTIDIFANDRGTSARDIIHIFLLLITLLLSIKYKNRLTELNKYYPIFHKLLFLQVFLYFVFYEFPEMAERVKLYFYVSNIVILPSFLLLVKQPIKKLSFICVLCVYSLFYGNVHILEKPFAIAYSPYQNYLIYKLFDLQSTGDQRLNQHVANTEATVK